MKNPQQISYLLHGKRPKVIPLGSETRYGWASSPLPFDRVLAVLAKATRQEKKNKSFQIGEKVKLSLFTDDRLYVETYRFHNKNRPIRADELQHRGG